MVESITSTTDVYEHSQIVATESKTIQHIILMRLTKLENDKGEVDSSPTSEPLPFLFLHSSSAPSTVPQNIVNVQNVV